MLPLASFLKLHHQHTEQTGVRPRWPRQGSAVYPHSATPAFDRGGEVNERSAALRYRAYAGVTKSGEELGDSQREAGNEGKRPLLLRRFCSSPGSRVVVWYKQAHKGVQMMRKRTDGPLRGRRGGDGLPDGDVSQTVLIKI